MPGWTTAVVIVGLLSALLAGFMAVVATDLKRALAYSTVSQLGFMVYAIGVGGVYASQFHLLSHAVFKALLFLGAGAVIHAVGTRDMRLMGGLGSRMPFTRTYVRDRRAGAGRHSHPQRLLEQGIDSGSGSARRRRTGGPTSSCCSASA